MLVDLPQLFGNKYSWDRLANPDQWHRSVRVFAHRTHKVIQPGQDAFIMASEGVHSAGAGSCTVRDVLGLLIRTSLSRPSPAMTGATPPTSRQNASSRSTSMTSGRWPSWL